MTEMRRIRAFSIRFMWLSLPLLLGCGQQGRLDGTIEIPSVKDEETIERLTCGPRALHQCLMRYGFSPGLGVLIQECMYTSKGVSLLELRRLAERHGLEAHGRSLDWEGLRTADCLAILHVDGDHFVWADPRETRDGENPSEKVLRVYDRGPAEWWERETLEAVWDGAALLLAPADPLQVGVPGPRLVVESCLVDTGSNPEGQTVSGVFHVQNAGSRPLEILDVKAGCGCCGVAVPKRILRPQETMNVTVEVDLTDKVGSFAYEAALTTNDPNYTTARFLVQGRSIREGWAFAKDLNWTAVRPGEAFTRRVLLADRGTGKLRVVSVRNELSGESDVTYGGSVEFGAECRRLEGNERSGIPGAQPGDYVLKFGVAPSEACPPGEIRGRVVALIEDGDTKSEIVLPYEGRIGFPVRAEPGTLCFVVTESNHRQSKQVRITREAHAELVSLNTAGLPITVSRRTDGLDYLLDVQTAALPDKTLSASLDCLFSDGSTVGIPCSVVRASR